MSKKEENNQQENVNLSQEFFSQEEVTGIIVNTVTSSVSGVIEWLKHNQVIVDKTTGDEIFNSEVKLPHNPRTVDIMVRDYIVPILKECGIDLELGQ